MRLFGKKKVEPPKAEKMDFSKYSMRLTIKAICMFEKLSGKNFFDFKDEDVSELLYCVFYTSNNIEIKYETFLGIMSNPQIANWAVGKFKDILEVTQQFKNDEEEDEKEDAEKEEGEKKATITDLATSLIVDYHVDAHYVMNEMNLWEIKPMFTACDSDVKRRYEENRLWTYLSIMPHIDGKKVNTPDKLFPFPWEKEIKKKKVEENLKNNLYAVKHTIGMSIDDILNGKR